MRTTGIALAAGVLLLLPASASGATATISNEAMTDVPLGAPTTITNMAPVLKLGFTPEEKRYSITITGPDGVTAAATQACVGIASYRDLLVNYLGNGKYTVAVTTSTDQADVGCSSPVAAASSTFQFTIAASADVTTPDGRILTRAPGSDDLKPHSAGITASPGTDTIEVQYSRNAKVNDDGSLTGKPKGGIYPAGQGSAPLEFDRPGRWAVVVRPRLGNGVGPWSAPKYVNVVSPFDLVAAPQFSDAKGPNYVLKGKVRAALGKGATIKCSIAKGTKGKKFTKLRDIKTKKGGRFKLPLTLTEGGKYRVRYRFKGNDSIARGRVTQTIKIAKVVV